MKAKKWRYLSHYWSDKFFLNNFFCELGMVFFKWNITWNYKDLEDKLDILFRNCISQNTIYFSWTEFYKLPIAQSYEELVLSLGSPLVYYIFSCTVYHGIIKFLTSIIEIYSVNPPPPYSALSSRNLLSFAKDHTAIYVCNLIKNSVVEITETVDIFQGRRRALVYGGGAFCTLLKISCPHFDKSIF